MKKVRNEAEYWGIDRIVNHIDSTRNSIVMMVGGIRYTMGRKRLRELGSKYFNRVLDGITQKNRGEWVVERRGDVFKYIHECIYTNSTAKLPYEKDEMLDSIHEDCLYYDIRSIADSIEKHRSKSIRALVCNDVCVVLDRGKVDCDNVY